MKNKDKSIEKILLKIIFILLFYILIIILLYMYGYVEERRILMSTIILILIISYFSLWTKIINKLEKFLYKPVFLMKTEDDYKGADEVFEKYIPNLNKKYKLEYILRTLIIIYKFSNPLLYVIEFFVIKFFFSVSWLNSKMSWKIVKHYIWVIKWVIIYPILRLFMLYYEFKEKWKKQSILDIILTRTRGLLISIILYLLFMSYVIDIMRTHYIIFLFSCYLVLALIPLLPEKIINKIKPQWEEIEYNKDEGGNIIENEKSEIIKNRVIITRIKEPDLLYILIKRRELTILGEIISDLFKSLFFSKEALFSFGNRMTIYLEKKNYYKCINFYIVKEWDDLILLKTETENKPSFLIYLYLLEFKDDVLSNFFMFRHYGEYKDSNLIKEDRAKLNNIYIKLIYLLKITLINLWKIEDFIGVSYKELVYDKELCRFEFPEDYIGQFFDKCWNELKWNKKEYLTFKQQIEEIKYLICYDGQAVGNFINYLDNKKLKGVRVFSSPVFLEDSIKLQEEMEEILKKEYRKIREEYEKNKNKGITELINNLLKK